MQFWSKTLTAWIMGAFLLGSAAELSAQCKTWINSPDQEAAEEAHVLYRQFLKEKKYDEAFPYWQRAYELAPAADGQRSFHFIDGKTLYMHKFQNETDPAKKKEYADIILRLYKEYVECYPKEAALALGLQAYDMFYYLRSPYSELLPVLQQAIEKGGMNTSYTVFQPYASVVVDFFQKGKMTKEEAREVYLKLNEIADYNIANNKQYSSYYQQSKEGMNVIFSKIEYDIFDCDYFKKKLEPEYRADPDNWDLIKEIYNRLVAQGCDPADPLVVELKEKYDVLVAEENAKRLAEFYAANPGAHAKALYDEGQYEEAVAKYKEAIAAEKAKGEGADKEALANYYFAIASIEFRKLKRYSSAREFARRAAGYRPDWGQPWMLIGDMYAATSKHCGNEAWDKQMAVLAAIDKYAYARSIDPSVAEEASEKIGRYSNYMPDKEEGFMRKISEGEKVRVNCWIGETVSVRYK